MRSRTHLLVLCAQLLAALCSARAGARECEGSCDGDFGCIRRAAECLMDRGAHREAVELLKQARRAHPEDGRLARLLATAYLMDDNRVWAVKTVLAQIEVAPEDLESRTWAAWLLIRQGDLDRAERLLAEIPTADPGPVAGRVDLLKALIARYRKKEEQAKALLTATAEKDADLFEEDIPLYKDLRERLHGDPGDPITARILLSSGYTSNATQSAPQDVAAGQEEIGSPLVSLDLVGRLEPWTSPFARPVGEIRLKGFSPVDQSTRGLSYLNLGGRAGGELGQKNGSRARLLYSYELLGIEDKGWYTEAHRVELELDLYPWYQVFGGAGRRIYEHLPRTRTEVDMGVAVVFPFKGGWNLTGIAAWRAQVARHEAFDDRGVTGLLRARAPLPWGAMIKVRAMALYDYYLYSEKYYGKLRKDLLLKAEAGPWTPDLRGFRIGLTYEAARRFSTVDEIVDNFNYRDHRVLVQVRWQGSFDPALPGEAEAPDDHIPLPYGLEETRDSGLDRVQDLLRQEEGARRGSMCVD